MLPEGMRQYTKNRGITHEEFASARRSLGVGGTKRKADKNTWKVSIKEIQERNYNLDFKNPNSDQKIAHKDPKELLKEIEKKERKIAEILSQIKATL